MECMDFALKSLYFQVSNQISNVTNTPECAWTSINFYCKFLIVSFTVGNLIAKQGSHDIQRKLCIISVQRGPCLGLESKLAV